MYWLTPALVFVFIQSFKDSVRKHSLNHFDNLAVLGLEFIFAFIFTFIWAVIFKAEISINTYTLAFLGLGFIQGFASSGKVNAADISLSQTTLLSKYNVFLPMFLSIIFLHEYGILSVFSLSGLLRTSALVIFPVTLYLFSKKTKDDTQKRSKKWTLNMLQYLLFAGVMVFGQKFFIDQNGVMQAVLFQRFGVMLTVLALSLLSKSKWTLRKRFLAIGVFDGFLISIANQAYFYSLALAPLVIVVPLQKMLEVFLTTTTGLFIFHEHKKINKYNKWGYVLSAVAVVLLLGAEILEMIH